MPVNQGQGRKSPRWYNICSFLTIEDSSDDSDKESVILPPITPTQTSTWQETSPPHSPSSQESETNGHHSLPLPPPPPPPSFYPPPPPPPPQPQPSFFPSPRTGHLPQINWPDPPLLGSVLPPIEDSSDVSDTESIYLSPITPTQTSTWQETSPPHSPSSQESETNGHHSLPLLAPPPLPSFIPSPRSRHLPQINLPDPRLQFFFQPFTETEGTEIEGRALLSPPPSHFGAGHFGIESLLDDIYQPPSPTHATLDHSSVWPEVDQSERLRIPGGVINVIRRVRISELHQRDRLSHCPICMEEFKVDDQVFQLPCYHTYCSECILRWLKNNKTCPICRLQLEGWEGQSSTSNNSWTLTLQYYPHHR